MIASSRLWLSLLWAPLAISAADFAVPADWEFQDALNAAQAGDTITLDSAGTYTGNFVLPAKAGSLPITIRTSQYDSLEDRRILPSDALLLPKIISPNAAPAIKPALGARGWRLLGLEVTSTAYVLQLIELGGGEETSVGDLPADVEIDRCYIHADPAQGGKRGVQINSRRTTIKNSYISDFWSEVQDAQAAAGWNGPGPFDILNSYLEASGENVIFGGSTPAISGVIPSDIRVIGNYFSRPVSWFGTRKQVKNLFEVKNGQRIAVEGNIFENNWINAQNGFALLLTVRVEGGTANWAAIRDVTIRNNIFRKVSGGINMMGVDITPPLGVTENIKILNNFFDIGSVPAPWGLSQRWLQMIRGLKGLTVDHNTVFNTGYTGIGAMDDLPGTGFVMTNNIAPHNLYGLIGGGTSSGVPSLNVFFPGYVMKNNVIVATSNPKAYISGPTDNGVASGNLFPPDFSAVRFENAAAGKYSLAADSPYRKAGTDGKDIGADMGQVNESTQYAVQGNPPPPAVETTYQLSTETADVVFPNESLSATWTLSNRGHLSDFVGLFDAASTDNSTPLAEVRTNGTETGMATLGGLGQTGNYELRYVTFLGSTKAVRPVVVASAVGVRLYSVLSETLDIEFLITSGTPGASDTIVLTAQDGTVLDTQPVDGSYGIGTVRFALPGVSGTYMARYMVAGLRAVATVSVQVP